MTKKKKIMTISDLYKFCIKNNFCHFSSSTDNEEICVQMPAIFEKEDNVDKDKEGLTPFVAKAYHDHINLNHSEIKPEVLGSTLPSAMLRPILASIVTDEETGEKDFGSHDFVFEEDEDGNEKIKYIEQPVGVIFGDNTIEYDEEDDVNRAILHGYLYNEYCQDAVDIMNRRKTVDCSVELSIREMSFNTADKVLTLDDFYVCGLTLLGSKVKPGMKGSKVTIEDFNKSNNSMFSNNEKVIELLETLNNTLSNFNKEQSSVQILSKEGGNTEDMNKFNELLEKYGKTVEDITFEYENMTDEELESKFEELFGEKPVEPESANDPHENESENDPSDSGNLEEGEESVDAKELEGCKKKKQCEEDDPESETVTETLTEVEGCKKRKQCEEDDPASSMYTKTFQLSHDDIKTALYSLLAPYEEANNDYYWITDVYDTYFVYQGCTGKYYGQKYTKDNDVVAFSGERYELYVEYLTESEKNALNEMRSNYSSIVEQLNSYKYAEDIADKLTVFEDESYSSYLETEAFKELMKEETLSKYSKEQIIEKADAALGKAVKESKSFAFNFSKENAKKKRTKIGVFSDFENAEDQNPYGDYFKSMNN